MRGRVAITGVGAVTPLGIGAETLLSRWRAGECGIEDGLGRCRAFNPDDHLSIREIRRTDRFTQLALTAADEAFAQAGWADALPVAAERIGCITGTGFGGMYTIETQLGALMEKGRTRVSPLGITLSIPNAAPGMIALRYGLKGSTHSVVSACAAGTDAIGTAARLICAGDVDAVVASGADASLTPLAIAFTERAGAMSKTGVSRPFDARRDGMVLGVGAGVLLLENGELADARGARVLAEVVGYGSTSDAYHLAAPDPRGDGARRAIELALRDADVGPDELAYVNAHGTSTELNDRSETEAIKAALGAAAGRVPVSSTKSAIGHLCGAAGAVEAVATVLALRERVAPPTLGYEQPEPGLDLDYVPGQARRLEEPNGRPLVALSNSFGFGGHNAVLCFSTPQTTPEAT
jgi:3-oxoacyl-[acyl-carrier-protein] synthase II